MNNLLIRQTLEWQSKFVWILCFQIVFFKGNCLGSIFSPLQEL